jgi:tight adherence protein B
VVGFLIYLIEPPYLEVLFNETVGRLLLAVGLTLQIIGYFWIRKIVDIEI